MYLSSNDRALYLYGGIMGAFLSSEKATAFDRSDHSWTELETGKQWLLQHNRLFTPLLNVYDRVAGEGLERAKLIGIRVGNRPGRVGQSLLADPIPIFSGSGHLMPDPVPTLVGIISGSTRSRTHLGEVLADPDRDLDRVAEFNPRYLT